MRAAVRLCLLVTPSTLQTFLFTGSWREPHFLRNAMSNDAGGWKSRNHLARSCGWIRSRSCLFKYRSTVWVAVIASWLLFTRNPALEWSEFLQLLEKQYQLSSCIIMRLRIERSKAFPTSNGSRQRAESHPFSREYF